MLILMFANSNDMKSFQCFISEVNEVSFLEG